MLGQALDKGMTEALHILTANLADLIAYTGRCEARNLRKYLDKDYFEMTECPGMSPA
jgi:hypothetical protein